MSDAVHLDKRQARALAWRLIERHIADTESWLQWEDLPYLDEATIMRMEAEVRETIVPSIRHTSAMYNKQWNIDAADLEERARERRR